MPVLLMFAVASVSAAAMGQTDVNGADINAAETTPAPRAEMLLRQALRTIEGCQSISARIVQEANLFDQHLVGSGIYLEQRSGGGYLMRMELKIQLGDQSSSLVQVCDGRFLWTKRNVMGSEELSRIDIAKVAEGLRRAQETGRLGETGILPGLGGLPRVIRGLLATFNFTTVESVSRGGQPVWKLAGQWKAETLAQVLPEQKAAIEEGKPVDLSKLPRQLPDQVVVFLLAREAPFLFRIEYRRATPKTAFGSDTAESKAMVTMELRDVDINVPIDHNRFTYSPGDIEFEDRTDAFLQSLGEKE